MLLRYGYSENCPRCALGRTRKPCAGVSHTATCRRRLEALIEQDEQMAEVLRRRDVRHGLVLPDTNNPAVAQDIEDEDETPPPTPTSEPVMSPHVRQRSEELQRHYDSVRRRRSTTAAGPTAPLSAGPTDDTHADAPHPAETEESRASNSASATNQDDYDPMPDPLGDPVQYGPPAMEEDELDSASTGPEKRSRRDDGDDDGDQDRSATRRRVMSINQVVNAVAQMGAKATKEDVA